MRVKASRHGLAVVFLAAATVLGLACAPGEAADPWQSGQFRDFSPASGDKAALAPATTTGLTLHHTTVYRPKVKQGDNAMLRAEYDVAAPAGDVAVKETRIVRYNGAKLAEVVRVIPRTPGRIGSEYQLKIPEDAAPGLYTVATTVEPAQDAGPASAKQIANAVFFVAEAMDETTPDEGDGIKIKVWPEKPNYKIGEPLRLRFETNKDAYVTLVNIGTTGGVTILYPNRFTGVMPQAKARTVYSVPASGDNYEITLSGPAGIELVYALVTSTPLKLSEADFGRGTASGRAEVLTRDLNIAAKRLPVKQHTKALLEIDVRD